MMSTQVGAYKYMPKPKDMSSRRGWGNYWEFWSSKNNKRIHTNSDLEYQIALSLEYDFNVRSYSYEPYRGNSELPDIDYLVERNGKKFLAECKYHDDLELPKVKSQLARQLSYASTCATKHLVITERNLLTGIALANMRLIIQWAALAQTSVQNSLIQKEILKLIPTEISNFDSLGESYEIQSALSMILLSGRALVELEKESLKSYSMVLPVRSKTRQVTLKQIWG